MHHFCWRNIKVSTALFCLAMLIAMLCHAQDNNKITTYSTADGLSHSTITGIIQDNDGFLWVGTNDGLCRYDGYNFYVYKHKNGDSTSICSDKHYIFHKDWQQNIWIISYYGVSKFNRNKDNFTNVFTYDPKNIVSNNDFYGEDSQYIWVGLCGYGILKIDKHSNQTIKENVPLEKPRPEFSWNRGFLDKNKLWSCVNDSFYIYDITTKAVNRQKFPLFDIISVNDSEAVAQTINGFIFINKRDLSHQSVMANKDSSRTNVLSMFQLSDSVVICCSTTSGLYYLNTRTKSIIKHTTFLDPDNEYEPLFATSAFKDRSGNLWIGTKDGGLKEITYPYKNFKFYHSPRSRIGVQSVLVDGDYLYVGYYGNGFDIFSRKNGFIKNVNLSAMISSLTNYVFTISNYDNGNVFLCPSTKNAHGPDDRLQVLYNKTTGKLKIIGAGLYKSIHQKFKYTNYATFFINKPDGSLITDFEDKLVMLKKGKSSAFTPAIIDSFNGESLMCGYADINGDLLIGTINGVYYVKGKCHSKVKLTDHIEACNVCFDTRHNIWITTNTGIYVVDSAQNKLTHYDESNKLVNEHIHSVICDNDGNMWFSHNRGLTEYKTKLDTFIEFAKDEGLQPEFKVNAFYKAPDGELFFGGISGVNSFYPQDLHSSRYMPEVKITSIHVADKPLESDSAAWVTNCLYLSYKQTNVSFEFALPEFTNTRKNVYSYKMEGLDDNWINSGTIHFARYSGLKPGNYIFRVKAANNEGNWGGDTSIKILISPPFWQTWWFILLSGIIIAILFGSLIIFIQNLRFRKKRNIFEMQQKIQTERERISRDLHDNVGTQLSLINKNLNRLTKPRSEFTDDEKMIKLNSVADSSKGIIDTLRETIWALNKEEITLEELSDKLKVFVNKQITDTDGLAVKFSEEDGNKNINIGPSEALHLFRICQEAISNTLKYANASLLEISIFANQGQYEINIKDNGVGFELDKIETRSHYGLDNLQFRANEISCMLSIKTEPGKGTMVVVQKK